MQKKVRIVQLSTDRLPCPPTLGGAIETFVYGISKEIAVDIEVHVLTICNGKKESVIFQEGIYYHSYNLDTPIAKCLSKISSLVSKENRNALYANFKILTILRKISKQYGQISVIHAHHFPTSLAPIVYKNIYHQPSIFLHWHNEPIKNRINQFLAKEYDVLLAVSGFLKDSLICNLNASEEKIKVIHNAVDTDVFKFNEKWREETRAKLAITDSETALLFVGRITSSKGLHLLIKAVTTLKQRGIKFKLLIVGPKGNFDAEDPLYFQTIECLIQQLNLQSDIIYIGRIGKEQLIKIYCASDIVVVPSVWQDPFPSVVIEAMSCRRIVIANSVGGIPEMITNGTTGYLIKAENDEVLLAETLVQAIYQLKKSSIIGCNARNDVERSFSVHNSANKLLDLYSSVDNTRA